MSLFGTMAKDVPSMNCPLQLIISWDIFVFMPGSSNASVILKGPLSAASLGPLGIGWRMETMPAWETSPVPPLVTLQCVHGHLSTG